MGASDFAKTLFDSLDKITDILNVGRLIFYTSAGFIALLPMAMCLRLLSHDPLVSYWAQFFSDMKTCTTQSVAVWLASLVFGFVIATLANAVVMNQFHRVPLAEPHKDHYSYQYARLFSGGVRLKEGTTKDYAAWLISEFYRYLEIVVFIPYAILLSLPVYALYTLAYLIHTAGRPDGFVLHAGHYAFALWTLTSVFAAIVVWPEFWFPRVAEPTYQDWVVARREAIAGLEAFIKETEPKETKPAEQETKPSKP